MDITKQSNGLLKVINSYINNDIKTKDENNFDIMVDNFKKHIDEETIEKIMPYLLEYCNNLENINFILGMQFIHNLYRRLES